MIFRKKKFKYYGDEYDDFEQPNKKEEFKLGVMLFLIVFLPFIALMIIRLIFKLGINLID